MNWLWSWEWFPANLCVGILTIITLLCGIWLIVTIVKQIIDETAFACSDKETRPVLTGVNLKAADHKIYANATDSYRLASKTIEIDTDLNFKRFLLLLVIPL